MKQYNNIDHLKQEHVQNNFTPDEQILLGEQTYVKFGSTEQSIDSLLTTNENYAIFYQPATPLAENSHVIAAVWGIKDNRIVPADVIDHSPENKLTEDQDKIGRTVQMEITNIPSANNIRAAVDTAATYSSLHADKWEVKGEQVHFVSKPLSSNVIRMPLETHQSVTAPSGDVEYRPVVSLDVKINGKLIRNQLFNLTDRSAMDNPALLGQNSLEDGSFIIDPKMENWNSESWNALFEQVQNTPINTTMLNEQNVTKKLNREQTQQIYDVLQETDVSFKDIIDIIYENALQRMENVSY